MNNISGVIISVPNKGTRYSPEFKKQVVDMYNSNYSPSDLCRKYGMSNVTLYKWIKNFSSNPSQNSNDIKTTNHDSSKNRISELEMECEVLKKVIAILIKNSNI